jgi:glycosyltransferase involved in cell wall biosynthesis
MNKILYLSFNGFSDYSGISKKKLAQIKGLKECGCSVVNCHYTVNTEKKDRIWKVDDQVLHNLGVGIWAKVKKRIFFQPIVKYIQNQQIEMVYIRSELNANPFLIHFVRKLRKTGVKTVLEIPTYPYDQEYSTFKSKCHLFIDKMFRKKLSNELEAIVTFSNEDLIFGKRTIRISNGIDFDLIRLSKKQLHNDELHMIGVAEIHYWHGFDRLIEGLGYYYNNKQGDYNIYFHIVGEFTGEREKKEILPLIKKYNLEENIILHGRKFGTELDAIFDKADIGVGSLGRHRSNITHIKTLKNREYAARGIPFFYSEIDDDFDKMPYTIKVPANESPIDIKYVVEEFFQISETPEQIRNSVQYLSWNNQMQKVLDSIEMKKKIAYCIPSLYSPSGIERVVSLKANYFAEHFDYDIYLILTDGKDKLPYFPLSSKINIINLDVNFDDSFGKPLLIKLFLYLWKQIIYRRRLTNCLINLRPDITISTMRREINFITSIKDGSVKFGEIHFSRSNYRDLKEEKLPLFVKKIMKKLWMNQLVSRINKLDKFIVLTHEDRKLWIDVNENIIETIHNPVSIVPSKTSNCQNKKVISVGRYTYQKGFDLLIKSWLIVNIKHPDWHLHVHGGGDRRIYQKQIDDLGLQNSCFLHPASKNIEEKYTESSIFVFSSRYEGFGLVLLEAMICGVPVVSFDCPCGPNDIIHDNEEGFLVINGDCSLLAERIIYLIENEKLRMEMGKKAIIRAKEFSMDLIAQQWKCLFDQYI